MKIRIAPFVTIAALAFAATAAAQSDTAKTKPTSKTRIPISKESPVPAPTPPRVDTVTVYKVDTISMTRIDTVTITRVDTVKEAAGEVVAPTPPPPMILRQIGGFYIGVDGGSASPVGSRLNTAQGTGWHVDVPFGWDPVGSPLGIRFSGGYTRFDGKSAFFRSDVGNPQVFQGDADLKLSLPTTSAWNHRVQLYALGGATYNRFRNLLQANDNGTFTVGDNIGTTGVNGGIPTTFDNNWHSAWGWNAGGGLQFGWGRTNLFVESRYIRFNRNGDLSQVPVVLGFSWY